MRTEWINLGRNVSMNRGENMHKLLNLALLIGLVVSMPIAHALNVMEYLTDAEGKYDGPTVEENIAKMDTDNNGFADVYEVRAFLEKKNGEGYQKAVLGRWEVNANSKSCGTSFIDEFLE